MSTPVDLALAYWELGLLRGDEFPRIAADALELGMDSPHLRMLAGLIQPTRDDVAPLLQRIAQELRLTQPSRREAGFRVARDVARRILAGELSPHDGARSIWWQVYNEIGYPDELSVFVGIASQLDDYLTERTSDPARYDVLIAESEAEIRSAAQDLVGSVAA